MRRDQQGAALIVERALGDQDISAIVALYAYFRSSFGNPIVDERDHRVLAAGGGGKRGQRQQLLLFSGGGFNCVLRHAAILLI